MLDELSGYPKVPINKSILVDHLIVSLHKSGNRSVFLHGALEVSVIIATSTISAAKFTSISTFSEHSHFEICKK